MERTHVSDQDARPIPPHPPGQLYQTARPGVAASAPSSIVAQHGGSLHALSPMNEADAREEAERRRQLTTLGLEVALAVLLTLAARIWDWAREERARARVNRELRRRAPAT